MRWSLSSTWPRRTRKNGLRIIPSTSITPVTGVVSDRSFRRLFPQLEAGSPLVFVRDNSRPKSFEELMGLAGVLAFLALVLWGIKTAVSRFFGGRGRT